MKLQYAIRDEQNDKKLKLRAIKDNMDREAEQIRKENERNRGPSTVEQE